MPTPEQLHANRQNAQHSTGPTSEEGKQRSSMNALKHGFSGLSLRVTDAEQAAYQAHVEQYFQHHNPANHQQTQLVQQLADLHWSLHQIFVQQSNTLSRMNDLDINDGANADLIALGRLLNNLNLYEVRRRRAAKQVEEDLAALKKAYDDQLKQDLAQAADLYKAHKAIGKSFDPAEFGFVCSSEDLAAYLKAKEAAAIGQKYAVPAESNSPDDEYAHIITAMEAQVNEMLANHRKKS